MQISSDAKWQEAIVIITFGLNDNVGITFHFLRDEILQFNKPRNFISGLSKINTDYHSCVIAVTPDIYNNIIFHLAEWDYNGQNVTNLDSTIMRVYIR